AIKHQAKTVTVGISRSDETLLQVPLVRELLATVPELQPEITAMLTLAGVNEWVAYNILRRTTAVNALLRNKLAPVFEPITRQMLILRQLPGR
ncbi:MAG: hypothetical protein WHV61_04230, partial [Burkholderiales bacterium]